MINQQSGNCSSLHFSENLDILLIGGIPLDKPVARYGFVMNTKAEIYHTVFDFQNGKMGRI
jgi:redox-sensitive bicupin YhaK (pirin superfamily)